MSYTKTTWADDDIITAEAMNNNENGTYDANQTAAAAAAGNPEHIAFALSYNAETQIISATTTADFSQAMAKYRAGKVLIGDAAIEALSGTAVYSGIISGTYDESVAANNSLNFVVFDTLNNGDALGAYRIKWTADAISVKIWTVASS